MHLDRWFIPGVLASLLALVPAVSLAQSPPDAPRAIQPAGTSPLEGTIWRLRDYVRRGIERQSGPEVAAWMQLRGGRIVGSGGCTRIRGSYAAMGAALKVNLAEPKPPTCGEQTIIVQLALVEGLGAAASYELVAGDEPRDTELVVRDAQDGAVLRFRLDDAGPLDAADWQLEAFTIDGQRTIADATQPAILSFRARQSREAVRRSDGDLVGSTGCNGVVGEFFRHADVLSFGPLEVTDAPCSPALMTQEAAILQILDASGLSLALLPDRLLLTSSDSGNQLELRSSRPLEETTWLLQAIRKSNLAGDTVTLWLGSGEVDGEGPCSSYSGRYATDGTFISFDSISGTGADDCDRRSAQRALFDALRRAVLIDREGGDLRLVDAAGKELARFRPAGAP